MSVRRLPGSADAGRPRVTVSDSGYTLRWGPLTSPARMRDRRRILGSGGPMARTSLMRALQRLAWEHRAASQLGIEVEELREREPMPGVPRREFLKRAGAAGAVAAVAGPAALARPARAAGAPRIAIVGGGIAGLAAALTLQDKGIGADVYESSVAWAGGCTPTGRSSVPASGRTGSRRSCAAS